MFKRKHYKFYMFFLLKIRKFLIKYFISNIKDTINPPTTVTKNENISKLLTFKQNKYMWCVARFGTKPIKTAF